MLLCVFCVWDKGTGVEGPCVSGHLVDFPVGVCWQCEKYGEIVEAGQKSL